MSIPDSVARLLCEYVPQLDLADRGCRRMVIERVMERGGWREMRWLVHAFTPDVLGQFLELRGRRVLPPRELRFWAGFSGVADDIADDWVRAARERQRVWRG